MKKNIGKKVLVSVLALAICFCCVDGSKIFTQAATRTIAKGKTSVIYRNNPYYDVILRTNASDYGFHKWENPAPIGFFKDAAGAWNVARYDEKKITIYTLNADHKVKETYKIKKRMENVGTIGYYDGYTYIVYGQGAPNRNDPAISICKYDRDKLVGEVIYTGGEAYNGMDGTQGPFHAGNCRIAVKNNLLVCFFGRQMYNGHQSNCSLYVNVDTMTKADEQFFRYGPYVSHSFAQRVMFAENGDIYFADQGDAYPRGFYVSRIDLEDVYRVDDYSDLDDDDWDDDDWDDENTSDENTSAENTNDEGYYSKYNFCGINDTVYHFREGENWDHGYNQTYAQMGGLTEVSSGIIFCGSAERTMSLADGGHAHFNEPRDVFIKRVLGYDYNFVEGETRKAVGKHNPKSLNKDNFGLTGEEEDTGIVWLSNYQKGGKYYARSPKIFTTEDDKIGVVWNKCRMHSTTILGTYLTLLNSDGTVSVDQKLLGNYVLDPLTDPVYEDGKLFWVSISPAGDVLFNELSIREEITVSSFQNVKIQKDYIYNPSMKPDDLILKDNGKRLKYGEDFTIGDYSTDWYYACSMAGSYEIAFEGRGKYTGVRKIMLKMRPPKPEIQYIKSKQAGTMVGKIKEEYVKFYDHKVLRLGTDSIEWQYSSDPKFKRDVHSWKGWSYEETEFYELSRGKTYYVRARMVCYGQNGDTINGKWSATKKVKVK